MASLADPELAQLAVEGLYGHALMLGYHPIGPADSALVNRSFLGLLDQAVPTAGGPDAMTDDLIDRAPARREYAVREGTGGAARGRRPAGGRGRARQDLAFYARLSLVTAYVMGGEPRKSLVPFARCVADWDADPDKYQRALAHCSCGASSTRPAR